MRHIEDESGKLSSFGEILFDYFRFRSEILNGPVKSNLMDKDAAAKLFFETKNKLEPQCVLPMNKQKGDKKNYSFLTGIVNMIVESNIGDFGCDYDPRSLTTVTHNSMPLRDGLK
ncbi:hypothetical protein ABFT82_22865 [Pseudomonas anguilliseptica]|nr:hypothetical protein [Pseudomonas anguilliseptica]